MRHAIVAAFITVWSVAVASGQNIPPTEFEVASVRPATPGRSLEELLRRPPPGQWRSFGLTLKNVIIVAYPEFRMPGQVVGDPNWVKETRFDLQARMSPTATHAEVQTMIRRLLADRFGLRTHIEQRTLDVYLLTLKTPGKLGPGLTPAPTVCVVWRMTGGRIPDECDLFRRQGGGGALTMIGTVSDLISTMTMTAAIDAPSFMRISSAIDRPVVDTTGLEGYFQIIGPSSIAAQRDGSFFTLMEEQLGLKLTRAREPVDVLVIDSVSMPEPD